jgi:mannose-6-phosphate isomerase-like protein (cupin superfamily)
MRHFVSAAAESYAVGPVDVARWEQYALGEELPFQAMWYTIAPRSSSPRDCHPEVELSVVISGTASVETAALGVTDVAAGSCFLLDSEEAHVIHNKGDAPLLVWSTYWMPRVVDAVTEPPARAATDDGAEEVAR